MSNFKKSCLPSDLPAAVVGGAVAAFAVARGTWTWFRNVDAEMSVIGEERTFPASSGAVIDARGRRGRRSDTRAVVGGRSRFNGAIPAPWAVLFRIVLALLARLTLSESGRARVSLTAATTT